MKITAVDPLELGYRKVDPPMARNFAVVRVETDAGLVGWGEASTNWGHSYPTVFSAAVRDVCAAPLLGYDPTDVRGRVAQLHRHPRYCRRCWLRSPILRHPGSCRRQR